MSFKTALRTRIKGDSAVSAIAGPNVYWSARPQGSPFPAVVLTTIIGERPEHFTAASLQRDVVQITCFASTQKVAEELRDAVIAAVVPAATVGGVEFQRAFYEVRDTVRNIETREVFMEIIEAEFRHN